MSIDAMRLALAALEEYTNVVTSSYDPNSWVTVAEDGGKPARDAITALRAAIEQAPWVKTYAGGKPNYTEPEEQPEQHEQTLMDALVGGTGVMLGDKRIDPASIYKHPEQDPVAWVCYGKASDEKHTVDYQQEDIDAIPVGTMLYTAPRQWQGLTDEEIEEAKHSYDWTAGWTIERFARQIEAKLKEKNHG